MSIAVCNEALFTRYYYTIGELDENHTEKFFRIYDQYQASLFVNVSISLAFLENYLYKIRAIFEDDNVDLKTINSQLYCSNYYFFLLSLLIEQDCKNESLRSFINQRSREIYILTAAAFAYHTNSEFVLEKCIFICNFFEKRFICPLMMSFRQKILSLRNDQLKLEEKKVLQKQAEKDLEQKMEYLKLTLSASHEDEKKVIRIAADEAMAIRNEEIKELKALHSNRIEQIVSLMQECNEYMASLDMKDEICDARYCAEQFMNENNRLLCIIESVRDEMEIKECNQVKSF